MTLPMVSQSATPKREIVEHKLPNDLLSRRVEVLLVGCGGTGSTMATGIVHLHYSMLAFGHPEGLMVTLVDGDRISKANCVRQPFSESEIGLYKADVLVNRINLFWGLAWKSDVRFLNRQWTSATSPDIIISCVDTRKARKMITQTPEYHRARYWLDLGNSTETGQFVIGQPSSHPEPRDEIRLPNVADLFPEIIDPALDAKDKLPSCSALEALESQSPFVNQMLAYQALAMLARFFRYGKLTYHGAFTNLSTGRVASLGVDLSVWKRIKDSNRAGAVRSKRKRGPAQRPPA